MNKKRWTYFERFEKLISRNKIKWTLVQVKDLDTWGQELLKFWTDAGYKDGFEISDVRLDGMYCIKLKDDFVQYIDIDPEYELFNYCYDNHHENRHPDEVLVYLLGKRGHDASVALHDDGTTVINVGGVTVVDLRRKK